MSIPSSGQSQIANILSEARTLSSPAPVSTLTYSLDQTKNALNGANSLLQQNGMLGVALPLQLANGAGAAGSAQQAPPTVSGEVKANPEGLHKKIGELFKDGLLNEANAYLILPGLAEDFGMNLKDTVSAVNDVANLQIKFEDIKDRVSNRSMQDWQKTKDTVGMCFTALDSIVKFYSTYLSGEYMYRQMNLQNRYMDLAESKERNQQALQTDMLDKQYDLAMAANKTELQKTKYAEATKRAKIQAGERIAQSKNNARATASLFINRRNYNYGVC